MASQDLMIYILLFYLSFAFISNRDNFSPIIYVFFIIFLSKSINMYFVRKIILEFDWSEIMIYLLNIIEIFTTKDN